MSPAHVSSMIFPMCSPLSISRCASAAPESGNRECTTGLHPARFDQRPHLRFQGACDGRLLLDGAGAERRAGDRQPPEHDGQHVELLDLRAALHRDDHQPPLDGEALQVPREVVAGHHVQHHVHAAPAGERADAFDEVLVPVADGGVGPEREAGVALRLRACGDVDGGAERLGELDRGGADAARSPVHQDRFPFGEAGAVEDVGPDREEGLGQGRGLGRVEPAGDGEAEWRGRGAVFGVPPAGDQRADAGADRRRLDALAMRDDDAGDFEPGDVRCAGAAAGRAPGAASRRGGSPPPPRPRRAPRRRRAAAPRVARGRARRGPPGSAISIAVMREGMFGVLMAGSSFPGRMTRVSRCGSNSGASGSEWLVSREKSSIPKTSSSRSITSQANSSFRRRTISDCSGSARRLRMLTVACASPARKNDISVPVASKQPDQHLLLFGFRQAVERFKQLLYRCIAYHVMGSIRWDGQADPAGVACVSRFTSKRLRITDRVRVPGRDGGGPSGNRLAAPGRIRGHARSRGRPRATKRGLSNPGLP